MSATSERVLGSLEGVDVASDVMGWRDLAGSVAALTALAVAQPLLDLLGRNPEFFLARASPSSDIIALALLVGVLLPAMIAALVLAVHAVHRTAGRLAHALALSVLGAIFAGTVLRLAPLDDWPALLVAAVAGTTGIAITWLHLRSEAVRFVFRFLVVAVLIVPAVFLFVAPTSRLAWGSSTAAQPLSMSVGSPSPVVMIIFDEFPAASVIDGDGELLADDFPNLARLATDGTWFRNAVGLHQRTQEALPTILSGTLAPLEGKVPSASDYPYTLFSLLAGSYEVQALETVTELCPDSVCHGKSRDALPPDQRWARLTADLSVVSGHLFLPADWSRDLPPIDQNWGDFGQAPIEESGGGWGMRARIGELLDADRRTAVTRFVDLLDKPLGDGELYFTHLMFPHWPWIHLPDGRIYAERGRVPGHGEDGWSSDAWLVEQAYQRHLLQAQYADAVVGEVIDRLVEHSSYDETLIIVLADHGGTVRPGVEERRWITPETVGDVAAIPLFIKRPHDEEGRVDDYRAETADVLPTIADVLDVPVPWQVDGVSLFAESRPPRDQSTMLAVQGSVTFDATGDQKLDVARYHLGFFGDRGPFGLAPDGYAGLLDREVLESDVTMATETYGVVDQADWYADADPGADFVPALISGTIAGDIDEDNVLAIVVGGRVVAVTRPWLDGEKVRFQAVIPPDRIIAGDNHLILAIVEGPVGQERLVGLAPPA